MAGWFPSRRILGVPAWLWVMLPIPLLGLGSVLWKVWLPSKLPEPPVRADVFREPLLVARDGDSFRFVPFGEHKGVKPLWAVNVALHDEGSVHWETHYFLPGFFRRDSRWTYELTALRFDDDWKGDQESPYILPVEQVQRLRPPVVAELNRRNPVAQRGSRLEGMLTEGLQETSYICPQNALILLGWLSVPMALVGLSSMFIRPRSARAEARGAAEPNATPDRGGMRAQ